MSGFAADEGCVNLIESEINGGEGLRDLQRIPAYVQHSHFVSSNPVNPHKDDCIGSDMS